MATPLATYRYAKAFERHLVLGTALSYQGLRWGRAEAMILCQIFESGLLKRCKTIDLRFNTLQTWDVDLVRQVHSLQMIITCTHPCTPLTHAH